MKLITLSVPTEKTKEELKPIYLGDVLPSMLATNVRDLLILSFVPKGWDGSKNEPAMAQIKLTRKEAAYLAKLIKDGLKKHEAMQLIQAAT